MSIEIFITLNILCSPKKPNNTHSSRWSKLEISNSLIFVHHLNQYFQTLFALSHFRRKCWMASSSVGQINGQPTDMRIFPLVDVK